MASVTPSYPCTKETTNYARLCRLLVEVGSLVLREFFDKVCPPANLHTVLAHPPNQAKLKTLKKKRVLNISQWYRLYPAIRSSVSSRFLDSSLLLLLLRNIFGLTLPASRWNNLPPRSDTSAEADITRIKFFRDKVYSHVAHASVDDATFNLYWNNIKETLLHIGGASFENIINDLETDCMDPDLEEHYRELLREWLKEDDCITDKSYEDEAIKKATKEEVMEDSIDISGQESGMEGECNFCQY